MKIPSIISLCSLLGAMTIAFDALNQSSALAVTVAQNRAQFHQSLSLHFGVYSPDDQEVTGDVLYLHGYGDTYENHGPLFEALADHGLRVIAFDFPSHGQTQGGLSDDLDHQTFSDLAAMAQLIEGLTLEDPSRPLILSGWSLGGLLAIRMAQSAELPALSRRPKGLLLFDPAVAIHLCVGSAICEITNATLTHDVSLQERQISPRFPAFRLKFAARMLQQTSFSWQSLPTDMPTLVWAAGERQDRYVDTTRLKLWAHQQMGQYQANLRAIQCQGAFHELDNESDTFGGTLIRLISSRFAQSLATEVPLTFSLIDSPCEELRETSPQAPFRAP